MLIKSEKAFYTYNTHIESEGAVVAVNGVSIEIQRGEFVSILGRNGSGKSTFARLLNALLIPDSGTIIVNNIDTRDSDYIWEIRSRIGMVFQNPDNQIVATSVEEDVAFGPENLGIEPKEIINRVNQAIEMVGMSEYSNHSPHLLSGGQKQRVAIAGILAMKPECIVLDEATAMLDPVGRKEIINILKELNQNEGITIIHITHHMEEAVKANRVIIMESGQIKYDGTPKQIFSKVKEIKGMGLDVPQVTELLYSLKNMGLNINESIVNIEDAVNEIVKLVNKID